MHVQLLLLMHADTHLTDFMTIFSYLIAMSYQGTQWIHTVWYDGPLL